MIPVIRFFTISLTRVTSSPTAHMVPGRSDYDRGTPTPPPTFFRAGGGGGWHGWGGRVATPPTPRGVGIPPRLICENQNERRTPVIPPREVMQSRVRKNRRYSFLRWGRVPPLPPPTFFGQGGVGGGSLSRRGGVPPCQTNALTRDWERESGVRGLVPGRKTGGEGWGGTPLRVIGGWGYPPPSVVCRPGLAVRAVE